MCVKFFVVLRMNVVVLSVCVCLLLGMSAQNFGIFFSSNESLSFLSLGVMLRCQFGRGHCLFCFLE